MTAQKHQPDAQATQTLTQGLQWLGLTLSTQQCDLLLRYHAMLYKWNQVYNLTAVPQEQGIARHLLDSLAVHATISALFLQSEPEASPRILDAGSGAGLPGIPLAIAFPNIQFYCIDAVEKKVRFLEQVRVELGLANVTCRHLRLEKCTEQPFDGAICRAFASTKDFLQICAPLVRENAWLMDMKSEQLECYDAPIAACRLFHVKPLPTSEGVRTRNLLIFQKIT